MRPTETMSIRTVQVISYLNNLNDLRVPEQAVWPYSAFGCAG